MPQFEQFTGQLPPAGKRTARGWRTASCAGWWRTGAPNRPAVGPGGKVGRLNPRIRYEVRPELDPAVLNTLFEAAWGNPKTGYERVFAHSFTWVGAWDGDKLVGFVNVAWDGDVHFFLLDTTVHPAWQRRGIGRRLVEEAIEACRGHGEWLHVDGDEELMSGLYEPTGFERTPAGVLDLTKARRRQEGHPDPD